MAGFTLSDRKEAGGLGWCWFYPAYGKEGGDYGVASLALYRKEGEARIARDVAWNNRGASRGGLLRHRILGV